MILQHQQSPSQSNNNVIYGNSNIPNSNNLTPNSALTNPTTNAATINNNNNNSGTLNSLIHSPSNLKNIFKSHHKKKPSQSSLISVNNLITLNNSTNQLLLSNSSNTSINNNSGSSNQVQSSNSNNNNNIVSNSVEENVNNNNTATTTASAQLQVEDIEIMKQRSANNNTFLCIKIPEIQLLVSYRGSHKDKKNFKDLNNVELLFPLYEVHDKTWTWLDLINALKSHVKKALLSQALKHKLKAPIQAPMNKLINRNKKTYSSGGGRRGTAGENGGTNNTNGFGNNNNNNATVTTTSSFNSSMINKFKQNEENEKLAMQKLFGTKYVGSSVNFDKTVATNKNNKLFFKEKKSSQSKSINNEHMITQEDNLNMSQSLNDQSIISLPTESKIFSSNKSKMSQNSKGSKLQKSHSTLSYVLKKKFLKLKDKPGSLSTQNNESSSIDSNN
jgi:hypothetical protein